MFGITGAITGSGNTHVTTELSLHNSTRAPYEVVGTIGKMPDVRGIMRVMACAYNRGWDPPALIVVHTGRSGHYDAVASFLQASKINTIHFEPKTYWRCNERGGDVEGCLGLTVFEDETPLPHVNSLGPSNFDIVECSTTVTLLHVLKDLTWELVQHATDYQGIASALAFYLAKSIVERSTFDGTDLAFLDRE